MSAHHLDASTPHASFDNSLPARLEIDSGDTVTFELREAFDGQVTPESTVDDITEADRSRIHSLVGPVAVRGADPGDTLEVELLEFEHHGWGWMGWLPGVGLLADEFDAAHLQHWRIEDGACRFRENDRVAVPFAPFCGILGVAPAEAGRFETMRFRLRKDLEVPELRFLTPAPLTTADQEGFYATTGHGTDLHTCAKDAVRRMVDWLESHAELSRFRPTACAARRGT